MINLTIQDRFILDDPGSNSINLPTKLKSDKILAMKKGVHPNYYSQAQAVCSCGNSFVTGSTSKSIKVAICSQCHPFFTGKSKFVDAKGRVERFEEKRARASKTSQK